MHEDDAELERPEHHRFAAAAPSERQATGNRRGIQRGDCRADFGVNRRYSLKADRAAGHVRDPDLINEMHPSVRTPDGMGRRQHVRDVSCGATGSAVPGWLAPRETVTTTATRINALKACIDSTSVQPLRARDRRVNRVTRSRLTRFANSSARRRAVVGMATGRGRRCLCPRVSKCIILGRRAIEERPMAEERNRRGTIRNVVPSAVQEPVPRA